MSKITINELKKITVIGLSFLCFIACSKNKNEWPLPVTADNTPCKVDCSESEPLAKSLVAKNWLELHNMPLVFPLDSGHTIIKSVTLGDSIYQIGKRGPYSNQKPGFYMAKVDLPSLLLQPKLLKLIGIRDVEGLSRNIQIVDLWGAEDHELDRLYALVQYEANYDDDYQLIHPSAYMIYRLNIQKNYVSARSVSPVFDTNLGAIYGQSRLVPYHHPQLNLIGNTAFDGSYQTVLSGLGERGKIDIKFKDCSGKQVSVSQARVFNDREKFLSIGSFRTSAECAGEKQYQDQIVAYEFFEGLKEYRAIEIENADEFISHQLSSVRRGAGDNILLSFNNYPNHKIVSLVWDENTQKLARDKNFNNGKTLSFKVPEAYSNIEINDSQFDTHTDTYYFTGAAFLKDSAYEPHMVLISTNKKGELTASDLTGSSAMLSYRHPTKKQGDETQAVGENFEKTQNGGLLLKGYVFEEGEDKPTIWVIR